MPEWSASVSARMSTVGSFVARNGVTARTAAWRSRRPPTIPLPPLARPPHQTRGSRGSIAGPREHDRGEQAEDSRRNNRTGFDRLKLTAPPPAPCGILVGRTVRESRRVGDHRRRVLDHRLARWGRPSSPGVNRSVVARETTVYFFELASPRTCGGQRSLNHSINDTTQHMWN